MRSLPTNPVLLLIDVQKGFDDPYWGVRNNPQAEANIAKLLSGWRAALRPLVHIRHMSLEPGSPLKPGRPGNHFKAEGMPSPGETVINKNVNSGFIGTNLEAHLRQSGYKAIVLCGFSTDHCVSTTARMGANLGFDVYVAADACATFNRTAYDGTCLTADEVHVSALASLHGEFATVADTNSILHMAARSSSMTQQSTSGVFSSTGFQPLG